MEDIVRFLSSHVPWQELPPERVASVARRLQIEYFPRGARVVCAGSVPQHLFLVRSGSAEAPPGGADGSPPTRFGEGDAFDVHAAWTQSASTTDIVAREDLLVYLIPHDVLAGLAGLPAMAAFLGGTAGGRIRRALDARSEGSFADTRVGDVANAPPLTCPPDTPVRDAARQMARAHMSSILVPGTPWGIVTDRDLRTRVLAEGMDPGVPVSSVATAPMVTVPAEARVLEALAVVMEHGIHHLPVVAEGVPIGVVTVTDLLRLQSRSPLLLGRVLERTRSAEDVEGWSRQVGPALTEMARAGIAASAVGRLAALACDALIRRLADAWAQAPDVPRFAWLALGAVGRCESAWPPEGGSLILLDTPTQGASDAIPPWLASTANVMERLFPDRSNPSPRAAPALACRTLGDDPNPADLHPAVLEALLDARLVTGTLDPSDRLARLARRAGARPIAAALLARIRRPPLAWHAGCVQEPDGTQACHLEVPNRIVRPIQNLARLASLGTDAPPRQTPARLRAAAEAGHLARALADDLAAAWEWAAGWVLARGRDAHEEPTAADRALMRDCFALLREGLDAMADRIRREDSWMR